MFLPYPTTRHSLQLSLNVRCGNISNLHYPTHGLLLPPLQCYCLSAAPKLSGHTAKLEGSAAAVGRILGAVKTKEVLEILEICMVLLLHFPTGRVHVKHWEGCVKKQKGGKNLHFVILSSQSPLLAGMGSMGRRPVDGDGRGRSLTVGNWEM